MGSHTGQFSGENRTGERQVSYVPSFPLHRESPFSDPTSKAYEAQTSSQIKAHPGRIVLTVVQTMASLQNPTLGGASGGTATPVVPPPSVCGNAKGATWGNSHPALLQSAPCPQPSQ